MIEAGKLRERLTVSRPVGGENGQTAPGWQEVCRVAGERMRTSVASGDDYAMEEYWHETVRMRVRCLWQIRVGWRVDWVGEPWMVRGVENPHDGSLILTLRRENE